VGKKASIRMNVRTLTDRAWELGLDGSRRRSEPSKGRKATSGAALRMPSMRAGVIDVGSNTVRLLVAEHSRRGLKTVATRRTHLGMGADVERAGAVSDRKLERLAQLSAAYAAAARGAGAERLEAIVTAPGRQSANGNTIRDVLSAATGVTARQLSAEDEGRLAYAGAVQGKPAPEPIGVVDVGGGSTQLMVGTRQELAWLHCVDVGSLRLTARFFEHDPPAPKELAAAVEAVAAAFAAVTPPLPRTVLATGGTARSLRRVAGRRLGGQELAAALEALTATPSERNREKFGITPERARVLPAGTVILREIQRRLGVELQIARGGVREGVVLGLLAEPAASAA
jgi:exopolyphosphatase / guanosine-5'-triphosphate,3'-diphosphate pyrophosphatase